MSPPPHTTARTAHAMPSSSAIARPDPSQVCNEHFSRPADVDRHLVYQHIPGLGLECGCRNSPGDPHNHRPLGRPDSLTRHLTTSNACPMGKNSGYEDRLKAIADELAKSAGSGEGNGKRNGRGRGKDDDVNCRRVGTRSHKECVAGQPCRELCKRLVLQEHVLIKLPCYQDPVVHATMELLAHKYTPQSFEEYLGHHGRVVRCSCGPCQRQETFGGSRARARNEWRYVVMPMKSEENPVNAKDNKEVETEKQPPEEEGVVEDGTDEPVQHGLVGLDGTINVLHDLIRPVSDEFWSWGNEVAPPTAMTSTSTTRQTRTLPVSPPQPGVIQSSGGSSPVMSLSRADCDQDIRKLFTPSASPRSPEPQHDPTSPRK